MRILLTFFLLLNFLYAAERPKIALVLSGGGARGGAHVGVLKVLEKKQIPIDLIIGTSMGAFVGGLYASGKSPEYIENMLVNTDWKKYIRTNFEREHMPMRSKEKEYKYQSRVSVGINADDEMVLPTGVLNRQPMLLKYMEETQAVKDIDDFDNLPIPFRAVATNIKNGDRVVLGSGSLAKAIYASTAIPGGFQPITIDGLVLVDGGVSDNIPISVAKEMGADIIIAVDVSEDFDEDISVSSYLTIVEQLMNIMMRKNANKSIATLGKQDILITPNLKGFGGLDADKYAAIIKTGVEVTLKDYDKKLKSLSLNDIDYLAYRDEHKQKVIYNVKIDSIEIDNPTYINNDVILSRINQQTGHELNEDTLRADIIDIYGLGIFDNIDYKVVEKDGKNVLKLTTTPSWNNHGEINFSFGFEDDFDGHSAYSIRTGYTMFGINSYGGEWRNDIDIGRNQLLSTEFFQPLDPEQHLYLKTSLKYYERDEYLPLNSGTVSLNTQRYGASLEVGTHMLESMELELGISRYSDRIRIEVGNIEDDYDSVPIHASMLYDTLDNLNFPNTGVKTFVVWRKEMEEMGSSYDFEQVFMDIEKPITMGNHNLTAYMKYGSTYKQDGIKSLASNFTLGGLFNLSGYVPYSLNAENMLLGVMKYRYRINDGGFFGSLAGRMYAGVSAEIGGTWGTGDSVSYDIMEQSGSVYFAADTILGPFYIAYGYANKENNAIYLYLGERF